MTDARLNVTSSPSVASCFVMMYPSTGRPSASNTRYAAFGSVAASHSGVTPSTIGSVAEIVEYAPMICCKESVTLNPGNSAMTSPVVATHDTHVRSTTGSRSP